MAKRTNVPLIRVDWQGKVQSILTNNNYAANPHRLEWQRETRSDPMRRMTFCIDLVSRKIDGCIKTLEKSIRRSALWEKALEQAYADLTRLEFDPPRDVVAPDWTTDLALSFDGQPKCCASGQCNVELCLCHPRKPGANSARL